MIYFLPYQRLMIAMSMTNENPALLPSQPIYDETPPSGLETGLTRLTGTLARINPAVSL
jgi:hypothetical protein